jgi:FkbM family methyltransferase
MQQFLSDLYTRLFARPCWYRFNLGFYYLSLHGLGIFNFKNFKISGEAWLLRKLAPGIKTVFDVGANQGNYAMLLIQHNPNINIYAFEPHPKTFNCLKILASDSIKIFNIGFGTETKNCLIYDYEEEDGSSHATLYPESLQAPSEHIIEHVVKIIRLDEQAEQMGLSKIDLLKIDTEGHEYDVLQGAGQWLRSDKIGIIHFEFNEMNVVSKHFLKDFFELLSEYRLYRLLPAGLLELNYHPLRCEIFAYQNIIAIHNSRLSICRELGLFP